MILAIDTGNTHTVIGCINDKNEVTQTVQISTDVTGTAYEYAVKIREIFNIIALDPHSFDGTIISSVVPQVTLVLAKAIRLVTGCEPLIVGAGVKTGLNIKLDDPGTIAGDLVATAVAAKEEYPLPCIIIDMGTATTITVIDRDGSYIGGCIMPGTGISLDALTKETSLLPSIDFLPPKKVIGTNTVDCMKGGIVFGSAGALDGVLTRYIDELGDVGSIVATGGMGHIIAPYCTHDITIDNHLLLKGLGYIYKKNKEMQEKPRRRSRKAKA
ncbi:MAG: type III pantothenate kinase [Lachnospiraceae bacterium]|jgi:type III pantothenate kinase|nr:type III pantothenate kinase [Lachnospiraceae bacterium]